MLRKNFLKREARVLGIDDGPYVRGSERTLIVLTLYRMDGYIDAMLQGSVETDGLDSSETIDRLLRDSGYLPQIRCIMSDGACLGGFNVLDIEDLNSKTGVPVMTVSDKPPDPGSIEDALRKHFDDWKSRLSLIRARSPRSVDLPDGTCYVRSVGLSDKVADDIVKRSTVHGRTPEPIRISHMVASVIHDASDGGGLIG